MNKTISINLGGLVFHIDEEAYEVLNSYIIAVEKQFENDSDKEDIISDIELRLAELFSERIDRHHDLITIEIVNQVIEIMGEPDEFADEEAGSGGQETNYRQTTSKRMYRDPDNRVLGGVCSGIGAYFHMDPLVFRILFIVFSLAFFSGIVIYLLLWIVIPEARTTAQKLEMRGEPITIENIKKAVKDEFENVKRKMNIK